MSEYIGYKDPIGNGMFNMGLTDEEIVRCRDCKHFDDGLCWLRKKYGYVIVEPNGYCAWGEKL